MKKHLKKLGGTRVGQGILPLVFLLTVGAPSAWGETDLQVLSMDPTGLTLEVIVPAYQMENMAGPDGLYHRIRVDGWANTSRTGFPELPLRGILIQVPQTDAVRVEVVDAPSVSIGGIRAYPVPRLEAGNAGDSLELFERNEEAYSTSGLYPSDLVSISERGTIRGTPVVRLVVHPFQWEAGTGTLRIYERVRLRVVFETLQAKSPHQPGPVAREEPLWSSIKEQCILNFTGHGDFGLPKDAKDETPAVAQGCLRIETDQEGIHRLTYDNLVGAGLPEGIESATFQIFHKGEEAAIRVETAQTIFAPGDAIYFYAQALDDRFTGTNVYWLKWGANAGKRMETMDGSVSGGATSVRTFYDTLHVEQNKTLWDSTPGAPDADYWFWERMTAPDTRDCVVEVPSPASGAADAMVRVCFQGRTTASPHPNHHTIVEWNGTEIGSSFWDGMDVETQEMTVSSSLLMDGANTCRVQLPGDAGPVVDSIYLNWLEVSYWRDLTAVSDRLRFRLTGNGPREVTVNGFGVSDLVLYDITDPKAVKEVTGFSVKSIGATYTGVFDDPTGGEREFWIGTGSAAIGPARLEFWQPSHLQSTHNGADWIVVTRRAFLSSVGPLAELRQSQGLRTAAVAVEDIYNEFSYGLIDPAAIKAFLRYAYENWGRPAPTYVLFVGDANMDYRDYLGTGKENGVPPYLIYSSFLLPSDNWYVSVDGNGDVLPDMIVGRIPGSSADGVARSIAKIVAFEKTPWLAAKEVLLVADNNETSFETINEALIPYLPSEFGVARVYLSEYGDVEDATQDIIKAMDRGVVVTNYVGHGSVENWAGEYLFDNDDIPLLSNGNVLTFVVAMTCLNGYFSQPTSYCLGEAFLAGDDRGAVGAFAPSGLGYVWEHRILDTQLFSSLFNEAKGITGSAVTQAKISGYALGLPDNIVEMFTLFGDPATKLKVARYLPRHR